MKFLLILVLAIFACGPVGCGDALLPAANPLHVVFLPLDGAVGVGLDVLPAIYFSDEVDPESITNSTVILSISTAQWDEQDTRWNCAATWSGVEGQPAVDATEARKLVFTPTERLSPQSCYRLSCTTALRGLHSHSMRDLFLPDRPGIGAEQSFVTGN